MEEEDQGDDKPPFITGKQINFTAEEVIKLLKTINDEQCITSIPTDVKGGDVYIFKPVSEDKMFDWKRDGLKWKIVTSIHIPKGKKDTVTKRSFVTLDKDKSQSKITRKDVYCPDFGESSDVKFLVHYFGAEDDTVGELESTETSQGNLKEVPGDVEDKQGVTETLEKGKTDIELGTVAPDNNSGESGSVAPEVTKTAVNQSPGVPLNRGHLKRDKRKRTYSDDIWEAEKSKSQKREEPVTEMTLFNGKKKTFPLPNRESVFSFAIVSEEEKEVHADFFNSSKKGKNSGRYLKIRNHIITKWNENKPSYVNKVKVRQGLTDCGDVSAIGRVYSYLECKGVINYNAVHESPRKTNNQQGQDNAEKNSSDDEDINQSPSKSIKRKQSDKEQNASVRKKSNLSNNNKGGSKPSMQTKKEASKTLNKMEFESPATRRSSSGRTRNIKSPNWADIMSGKVAFRDDDDDVGNSSPSKSNRSNQKSFVKSMEKRGRPGKQKVVQTKSKTSKTNIEDMKIKDSKLSKKGHEGDEEECEKDNGDEAGHEADEEENDSHENVTDKASLITDVKEGKKRSGSKTNDNKGTVNEKNMVENSTSPHGQEPLENENDKSLSNENETPKRGRGRPKKIDLQSKINHKDVEQNEIRVIEKSSLKSNFPNTEKGFGANTDTITQTKSSREPREDCNNPSTGKSDSDTETAKTADVTTEDETHLPEDEKSLEKDADEHQNEVHTSGKTIKKGRGRPHKVRSESEERKLKEKTKRGRGRPRKYPEDLYRDSESQSQEDVIELAGPGNLCKVRVKGNRHMPFQLKEVKKFDADESVKIEPENTDNVRSSSRVKRNRYECEVCKKGFSVEYIYEEHKKSHIVEGNIDMPLDFDDIDDSDNDGDFRMKEEKQEESDGHLDDESLDEEKHEKSTSVYKTESKKSIRQKISIAKVGEDGKPACSICDVSFLTFANLRKHSLLHSDCMYECPYCAKLMKRKDYVNAHIRKVHRDIDVEKTPVDFDKYTHVIPGAAMGKLKTTKMEEELEQEDDNSEKKSIKSKTGLGKSVCPDCNKVYDVHEDLEQHMILVHNKELKDAAYTCLACGKEFKSLVSYQVHKLTHRKKNHDCQHCGKVFKTNSQLQVHRRHDHNVQYGTLMYFGFLMNEGKIACEVCSSRFDSMGEYHDHRLEHLTFEYLCKECGNGFDSEEEFEKHQDSKCSYQNLHLPCGVCDQRFSMYDTRRKHIVAYHPKDAQNHCHHCGCTFDKLADLTEHFACHMKEKVFICEFCEKKFFEKRNLIDHRVLHRSSKNYKCSICDNFYISSKSLQRHIKLHLSTNKFSCSQCESKFTKKDDLERHFLLNHSGEDIDSSGNTCNICGKKFLKRTRLVKHMQVHIKGDNDSTYTCSHCEAAFNPKDMPLWKHIKENHPEVLKPKSEKKELVCETCGFTTVHPQRLTRHLETHNPDKRFSCMYCDKLFQTTSSLLTHVMIHRGRVKNNKRPPTDCSWPGCHKKFFKRAGMKAHLLTHIFKVKNGKDTCECINCAKPELVSEFAYFQEGDNTNILMDGNTVLLRSEHQNARDGNQNPETINVVINSDGVLQSYESMNVLQEAIAKIEDLEKGTQNGDTDANELMEMTDVIDTLSTGVEMEVHENRLVQDIIPLEEGDEGANADIVEDGVPTDISIKADSTTESGIVNSTTILTEERSVDDMINAPFPNDNSCEDKNESESNINATMVENTPIEENAKSGVDDMEVGQPDESTNEDSKEMSDSSALLQAETVNVSSQNEIGGMTNVRSLDTDSGNTIVLQVKNGGITQDLEQETDELEEITQNTGEITQNPDQQNNDSEKNMGTDPEGFECTYCELLFQTKCMVLSHLEEDHIDHQFPACEICGKHFIDNKSVRDHLVIHSSERGFACDQCDKAFRTKQCLRQHMFIHSEVKPFICSYCGHGFTQKGFFEEHVRRHTGQKPFKCKICFKGFYSQNLRKLHMYTHTGNNPFKCDYCTKSFRERYVLEAHLRTHRNERPFKCGHCEKAFFVRPKLIRHLNTVHGIRKEYLTDFFPTKIGTGVGYRNRRTSQKPKVDLDEPRKTQIVYIDHQGNIVSQEMKTETDLRKEKEKTKREPIIKRVAPKPAPVVVEPQIITSNAVGNSQAITSDTFEVLTRKDATGQIVVNPIISGEMAQVVPESEAIDMGQNIVYQDIQTFSAENNIELDGENYTFVTQGDDQGHIQLIKHALAGVQGQIKQDGGEEIQIISEEVDTGDIQAHAENDVAVYTGEGGEGVEHVAENFSINIGEDGTVDAADFEKIEALRTLYNDQPIVIVLESQQVE